MRLLVTAAVAALITATAVSAAALPIAQPGQALPGAARSEATAPTSLRAHTQPPVSGAGSSAPAAGPAQVGSAPAPAPAIARLSRGILTRPLSPRPGVHRWFEQPRSQWSRGHRGVDLLAAAGQPVLSAGDGVVAFSGEIAGRGVITVRHSGVLRTTYEPVDGRLTSGTRVHRGSRMGVLSPTPGHCIPLTCLHWGAISGAAYLDPLSLLGVGRPILLPLG